jgi:hypothetical protein
MDLRVVAFPALIAANDGWVQYVSEAEELSLWTTSAIKKYNGRRVVLYDSNDHAWEVDRINPVKPTGFYARLVGRKIPVSLSLRPVSETPFQLVRDVINEAIDVDDDILTQSVTANELKACVQKASSFQTLVHALKTKRAI